MSDGLQQLSARARAGVVAGGFCLPLLALGIFHFAGMDLGALWQLIIVGALLAAAVALAVQAIGSDESREHRAVCDSVNRVWPIIEYAPDGNVITANQNQLSQRSYKLSDIVGQHHSVFVPKDYAQSAQYRAFWDKLRHGEYVADKYKRKSSRTGKESWIQNNYVPVLDRDGKVIKIMNFMVDITESEQDHEEFQSLARGLRRLAEGELTVRIDSALKGEYEELRQCFNSALARLHDTIQSVMAVTSVIGSKSDELLHGAQDLSHRTEEQAASLEETAAALEQITATLRNTAANTKDASTRALAAKSAAEQGGHVVETAMKAMAKIEQSSKQITDIIGVIDEIAFQTNLLALNAGVEAARAGDAGKGFAVVATEVRELAGRSGEAAKKIKSLIKSSSDDVVSGVKLVNETGQALSRIVEQVVEINALLTGMAQAAEQQSTGIDQVNTAVGQMDQMTQHNASIAQQSSAATEALVAEAGSLSDMVKFFSVNEQHPEVRRAAA
jgi:methyl-accepting chemotaxis protein